MFAKSNQVERYLDSIGADYKYRDSVPIAKLEPGWASTNPCRAPGKAIIDAALSYAERMQNGEAAPPAIYMMKPTGIHLLDGRQRVFAADSIGSTVFSAYELIGPSERLERLVSLGANAALNGVRPSQEWLIGEAIKFMRAHNASAIEASRLAGVAVNTIETHLATMRVRDALVANGVEPQLANGTLAALEPFLTETSVLTKAYQAVEEANATVPMTKSLVEQMLKQPGKGRFMALDDWKSMPEIQARIHNVKKRKMDAKQKVFQAARALKTIMKDEFEGIAGEMKDPDRKELAKILNYIHGKGRMLTGEFSSAV